MQPSPLLSACALLALLAAACTEPEPPTPTARPPDPWSNAAERQFQQAEALRYELEQQKLEQQRLRDLAVEGQPPPPRR
jgi:hypothetical protein